MCEDFCLKLKYNACLFKLLMTQARLKRKKYLKKGLQSFLLLYIFNLGQTKLYIYAFSTFLRRYFFKAKIDCLSFQIFNVTSFYFKKYIIPKKTNLSSEYVSLLQHIFSLDQIKLYVYALPCL